MKQDGTYCKYKLSEISGLTINELIDRGYRFTIIPEDDGEKEIEHDSDE